MNMASCFFLLGDKIVHTKRNETTLNDTITMYILFHSDLSCILKVLASM
jgi:hypothetical protein